MKISCLPYFTCILLPFFLSCQESKKTAVTRLVNKWTGKEIILPPISDCTAMGKATPCPDQFSAPYKVLLYTDSTGCTSCKLNLHVWKAYMEEAETLAPGQVDFLFYFQPKNLKELEYLLKRDRLDCPVFIDDKGELDRINQLPEQMEYQCFLLDRDNQVLAIGNPAQNPKMWEIYKQLFTTVSE